MKIMKITFICLNKLQFYILRMHFLKQKIISLKKFKDEKQLLNKSQNYIEKERKEMCHLANCTKRKFISSTFT